MELNFQVISPIHTLTFHAQTLTLVLHYELLQTLQGKLDDIFELI